MPKTDVIFVVQGFASQTPDGLMQDIVTFEIKADNESEAIKRAKKYIKRKHYRVSRVIEK